MGKPKVLRRFVLTNSQGAGSLSIAAPANGATVVVWDSGSNLSGNSAGAPMARQWRRYNFALLVSHAVTLNVQVTWNDGTNWETYETYAIPGGANIFQQDVYTGNAPRVRFQLVNGANDLTTFRGELSGEPADRAIAA